MTNQPFSFATDGGLLSWELVMLVVTTEQLIELQVAETVLVFPLETVDKNQWYTVIHWTVIVITYKKASV